MQLRTAFIFGASFLFFTTISILIGNSPKLAPDLGLSVHQFSKKCGYSLLNETVETEDGYILTMHRIQCTRSNICAKRRPPVLILHGLLGSSADFLAAKNQSLAFQLADKGYDVWLGNSRGNTYARDHVMLDADDDKTFWDFSFHEIGVYDLPAMIDYILAKTGASQLTYVGMSQGCAAYMVMNSLKPEYNDKVVLANLMAPVTTFYATRSVLFTFWSYFNFIVEDLFPFHLSVSPAGASTKQFQHMVQNRISGQFGHYDYYDRNQEFYHQDSAPIYNISKITVPVAVYFGKADIFVSVEGLYQQIKSLPNVVLRYKVPYTEFNHMDFIYAQDLNILVNNKLIEMIDRYNKKVK